MGRTRAAINRKSAEDKAKAADKVDIASQDSFPASDPPAFATPQPEEPDASPQQADWKAGKSAGRTKAPRGTEERRHRDQTTKG